MKRLFSLVLFTSLLAGCSTFQAGGGSWVEAAAEGDAGTLSEAVVVFVAQSVPPTGTTIDLVAPPERQAANLITLQIREKLSGRGYQLDGNGSGGQRHRVLYIISPYNEQLLLRVTLDAVECSVLFGRDEAGNLRAVTPLSMRRKGQVL